MRAGVAGAVVAILLAALAACGSPADTVPSSGSAATPSPPPAAAEPPTDAITPRVGPLDPGPLDPGPIDPASEGAAADPDAGAPASAASEGGVDGPVSCPESTTTVRDAAELEAALANAQPGHVIHLADATYTGEFTATQPATTEQPIFLCGGRGAVLEGHGVKEGYVLHLEGADHWRLVGFTVRNGKKGVMVEQSQHVLVQQLTVTEIGDEAIHLRRFSSDGAVLDNTISRTGLRRDKFGEGIYVGTAESNWCDVSGCQPDASDRTLVQGNRISATTAESIDIKEGTTGGKVIANTFDGALLSGADSWVDVKGNDWVIEGNKGTRSPADGFQTHEILDGWGTRNVFRRNVAAVHGPGFGFHLAPVSANTVGCDNVATGAAQGLSNTTCTSS